MKKLFYIDTKNGIGQVLVFGNYHDAVEWCKVATKWDDQQITQNIRETLSTKQPFTSLFIRRD